MYACLRANCQIKAPQVPSPSPSQAWRYSGDGNLLEHAGHALGYDDERPHAAVTLDHQALKYDAGQLPDVSGDGPLSAGAWRVDAHGRMQSFTAADGRCVAHVHGDTGERAIRREYDAAGLVAAAVVLSPALGAWASDLGSGHCQEQHIRRWMKQLVEKGKLTWHGTHVLPKTCGTRIADGGGGVSAVASHLRHKSLQTASRYIDQRGASSRALKALES